MKKMGNKVSYMGMSYITVSILVLLFFINNVQAFEVIKVGKQKLIAETHGQKVFINEEFSIVGEDGLSRGTGRVVALKNNRLLLHFVGEAKTGYTLKSLNVEASKSVVHATDLMLDIPPEKSRNSGYRMPASSQFQPSNKLNSGITLGGFYSKFKTEVDDTNEEFDNSLLNLGLSFSKLYGLFEPYISLGYEFSKREQEGLEVKTSSLSFSLGLRYNFQKFQKSQITPFISLALGYLKENNEGEEESREVGDIEIKGSGFFGSVGLGAKYFVSHQAGVLLGLWYLKSFSYELEEEGGDVDVDISGFKGLIGLFLYF